MDCIFRGGCLLYFREHFGEVGEDLVVFEEGVFVCYVGDDAADALGEEVGEHS